MAKNWDVIFYRIFLLGLAKQLNDTSQDVCQTLFIWFSRI